MTWMKLIKQGINSALVMSVMFMCLPQGTSKKIEPDKPVTTVVNKKSTEDSTLIVSSQNPNQININQASAEVLAEKLNGIGMHKAKAIVEYRDKYGAFNSLENILEVKGIGPSFLEKNRDKLIL
ncbi:competence protein ComEA [Providencia alcalifaciens]|nr:competence protein ComEA [Providencia alcalifaciens]